MNEKRLRPWPLALLSLGPSLGCRGEDGPLATTSGPTAPRDSATTAAHSGGDPTGSDTGATGAMTTSGGSRPTSSTTRGEVPPDGATGSAGTMESTGDDTGAAPTSGSTGTTAETGSTAPLDCAAARLPTVGVLGWLAADRGLEQDEGRVVRWEDQADASHAATPSSGAPRVDPEGIGGRPAIVFDGESDELTWREVALRDRTELSIAMVNTAVLERQEVEWCCHTGESGCSGTYEVVLTFDGTANWGGVILSPLAEEVTAQFRNGHPVYSEVFYEGHAWGPGGYGTCRSDPERDPLVAWQRPASIEGQPTLTVAVKAPQAIDLYVAGERVWGRSMPGDVAELVNAGSVGKIGGGGYSSIPRRRFAGRVAEIVIFDHALSPTERTAVEAYLACKYGLQTEGNG